MTGTLPRLNPTSGGQPPHPRDIYGQKMKGAPAPKETT